MKNKFFNAISLAVIFSLLITSLALADTVTNSVAANVGSDTITVGGHTTVSYKINATGGDGEAGCNAADGSDAAVTINVPANVTVTPSSLAFDYCGNPQQAVDFTASVAGNYSITVSVGDGGAGSYSTGSATFTLHVNAPVVTNTPPSLTVPGNITAEATGAAGAVVNFSVSATDAEDNPDPTPSCSAVSGSTFPIGTTTVNCSVTDSGSLSDADSFTITVQDTTAPDLTLLNVTAEATGPSGAAVIFSASANDIVNGAVAVLCDANSGDTFALGTTTVNCSAEDAAGNTANGSFTVTVQDTISPALSLPANITEEAIGPAGNVATYSASASDLVDGSVAIACVPASGSTFPITTTTVNCSASDSHSNTATGSFTIKVQDTTPPSITVPANITTEATGPSGAVVSFSTSASDIVDGAIAPTCSPASGSTFALSTTTVTCSATDAHGNTGSASFDVTVVDTMPPTLTLPANITVPATSPAGAVVTFSASASDLVDGSVAVICSPASGSTFAPGTTVVNCSATDSHGNTASGSFSVSVKYQLKGFYAPVDMFGVYNVVKGGSTVPFKFEVFAGSTELTDVAYLTGFKFGPVACDATAPNDAIETLATGETSLRYDWASGQFIYNWKTPKTIGCYSVTMTADDGSTLTAFFKLK